MDSAVVEEDDSGPEEANNDSDEESLEVHSLPGFLVEDEEEDENRASCTSFGWGGIDDNPEVRELVDAEPVEKDDSKHVPVGLSLAAIAVMLLVILLLGLGLGGAFDREDDAGGDNTSSTTAPTTTSPIIPVEEGISPTLTRIQERGALKCAYTDVSPLEKALVSLSFSKKGTESRRMQCPC